MSSRLRALSAFYKKWNVNIWCDVTGMRAASVSDWRAEDVEIQSESIVCWMDRLLSSSFLRWFLFTLRVLVLLIFFYVFASSTFTCTRINNQSPDHSGRRVNSFMTFAVSDYENSDKHTFFCTIFRLTRCTINVEEVDVFSARVHNVTRKSIINDKWRHVDSMFLLYVTYLERNPTNCLNHGNPSNLNIILKE